MRLRRIRDWLAQAALASEPLEKCRFSAPPVVERFRPFNPSRGFAKPEVTGSIPVLHTRKARDVGLSFARPETIHAGTRPATDELHQ
jgi:hypothetical protein